MVAANSRRKSQVPSPMVPYAISSQLMMARTKFKSTGLQDLPQIQILYILLLRTLPDSARLPPFLENIDGWLVEILLDSSQWADHHDMHAYDCTQWNGAAEEGRLWSHREWWHWLVGQTSIETVWWHVEHWILGSCSSLRPGPGKLPYMFVWK